jgi:hypothetical protein
MVFFNNKKSKDLVNSVNILSVGCGLQVNDAAVIFGLRYISFVQRKVEKQTRRGGGEGMMRGAPSL